MIRYLIISDELVDQNFSKCLLLSFCKTWILKTGLIGLSDPTYSFIFSLISGLRPGEITFGKWVGYQNWKCPNRDIKFSKPWNNW